MTDPATSQRSTIERRFSSAFEAFFDQSKGLSLDDLTSVKERKGETETERNNILNKSSKAMEAYRNTWGFWMFNTGHPFPHYPMESARERELQPHLSGSGFLPCRGPCENGENHLSIEFLKERHG
jgi:hypothetical protein